MLQRFLQRAFGVATSFFTSSTMVSTSAVSLFFHQGFFFCSSADDCRARLYTQHSPLPGQSFKRGVVNRRALPALPDSLSTGFGCSLRSLQLAAGSKT
ncbi:hypothetical protein KIF59_17565 [Enterobacter cloacae subsp. cloacae]|nr:hypothetical protein [Enterobacter cloacae subsp. cloacae]